MAAGPDDSNGTMLASDARTAPLTRGPAGPDAAPGVELTGHVRDHTGRPVDAVLTLVDGGGHQVGRGATDTEGEYRLPAGPATGPGLLVVRGRDGSSAPAVVSVVLGVPAVHDVELDSGARRRGREPGGGLLSRPRRTVSGVGGAD